MRQAGKPAPEANRSSTLALLGSFCLFLSAIEYIIPKPLPFMRIGLANLPLLLALDILSPADFFLLVLIKVFGQGILSGTLVSYVFLFSLAGTFSSAALMYGMRKLSGKKRIGFAGIGCAGAMVSNGMQLLLARYLIFGASIQYLIPPFLASGFITGIALGVFCEIFCSRSMWYAGKMGSGGTALPRWGVGTGEEFTRRRGGAENAEEKPGFGEQEGNLRPVGSVEEQGSGFGVRGSGIGDRGSGIGGCGSNDEGASEVVLGTPGDKAHSEFYQLPQNRRIKRREKWNKTFSSPVLFAIGIVLGAALLLSPSLLICAIVFLVTCALAWVSGKKTNVPLTVLVMAGIVIFNLLAPYGKVLFSIGTLHITQGSLASGLRKAMTLEGLVMISGACIKSDLRLPGKIGGLLAESFRLLEKLRGQKTSIRRGNVIGGIDRLMIELEEEGYFV
ncbi:MAG: Gx transporter family protein [Treponema sp.]|nr:Gx transporter family protein [Treponema sp.]